MNVFFKICRRRQHQSWWTDITFKFSSSGKLTEAEAKEYANDYKRKHMSDDVTIVKVEQE